VEFADEIKRIADIAQGKDGDVFIRHEACGQREAYEQAKTTSGQAYVHKNFLCGRLQSYRPQLAGGVSGSISGMPRSLWERIGILPHAFRFRKAGACVAQGISASFSVKCLYFGALTAREEKGKKAFPRHADA